MQFSTQLDNPLAVRPKLFSHNYLAEIDQLAAESNYSRNELINIILSHGAKNIVIE